MSVRIDGALFDIPPAERGFHHFTSQNRADMQASHRLGYRQKARIGEVFWTHPLVPDIAFPTRRAALMAALKTLSSTPPSETRHE